MNEIETMNQWRDMAAELSAGGYTLYQMQYGTQHPDGFHARFWAKGMPDIEVVTHSDAVHDAIAKFEPE